jgi:hypothetical protein
MARTKRCDDVSPEERERAEFERLCAELSQNDPDTGDRVAHHIPFNSVSEPEDASRRLAEALAGNTHVSCLDLELGSKRVSASLGMNDCLGSAEPLLHHLRQTQIITTVSLSLAYSYRDSDPLLYAILVRYVLAAIAVNARIDTVDLWIRTPIDAFCTFMQTARIKSLALSLRLFGVESKETLPVAFAAAQSLESLSLIVDYDSDLFQPVLQSLQSHPCMHTLALELQSAYEVTDGEEMEFFEVLSHFLRSTVLLQTVRISTDTIKLAGFELFLQGVSDSVSLKTLVLNFTLDEDARSGLVRFAQSIPETGSHSIQHLCLRNRFHRTFVGTIFGSVLGPMLAPQTVEGDVRPSVGSLLQELSFDYAVGDLESFFAFLATNTSRLSVLRLGGLCQVSWMRHLPDLLYLRELHISYIQPGMLDTPRENGSLEEEWMDPYDSTVDFIQSFRRNGSLHQFSLGEANYSRYLNDSQMQLVHSFCQRNRETLSLLTKPSLEHDAMAGSDDVATHLPLFPHLIAAARHAKRTAANMILAGMLSTYDAIGTSGNL